MGSFSSSLTGLGTQINSESSEAGQQRTDFGQAFPPPVPKTMEELGLSQGFVADLVLRRLFLDGFSSLTSLSRKLKLSVPIIEVAFKHLRGQQLIEVKGMIGQDYSFVLTTAGRQLAADRFAVMQYASAAPVSLRDYDAMTRRQAARVNVDRQSLRRAFGDLVVSDQLLDQLGPALISQNSIFLYGPTGNGKTSIAERMLRVYEDAVLLPYAVEVDNQVIQLFDPVVHERIDADYPEIDPRWVLCKRPCLVVGGELVPNMLELHRDDASGIYSAPLQMKANNGIFIIDDFGRQMISPRELLNRWIVPLDRKVDYLSLRYGVKFAVPFATMVVFSTNLDPSDLADEAFLRRIQNKILIEAVEARVFDQIFEQVFRRREVAFEAESAQYLRGLCLQSGRAHLRACYPQDICNLLVSISRYEKRPATASREDLSRAVNLYFARD
jgi:hypothetical protein